MITVTLSHLDLTWTVWIPKSRLYDRINQYIAQGYSIHLG
jgi:hypothetical protein